VATLFDAVGAERLTAVIRSFYDAVFEDPMIGFFFAGRDKERLIRKELELVAAHLGADVPYTGRPIDAVHAPLPILGGHFERRLRLLEEAMERHGVPPEVRRAWVEHTRSLRPLVTADAGTDCDPEALRAPYRRAE
jgi:truncated hemoglobin YjbI